MATRCVWGVESLQHDGSVCFAFVICEIAHVDRRFVSWNGIIVIMETVVCPNCPGKEECLIIQYSALTTTIKI
ncbi:hypothetical protein T11_12577 [Trichinella zimbabwensis]|uniref:Uncharacterized protein n=1 Tax=Trichinella zimbabwensis TaxID=268475 RepID=A0A0V1GT41_9BILA|nr:hypothetical protein T11_12577 [Trichinella zimbabwensis]